MAPLLLLKILGFFFCEHSLEGTVVKYLALICFVILICQLGFAETPYTGYNAPATTGGPSAAQLAAEDKLGYLDTTNSATSSSATSPTSPSPTSTSEAATEVPAGPPPGAIGAFDPPKFDLCTKVAQRLAEKGLPIQLLLKQCELDYLYSEGLPKEAILGMIANGANLPNGFQGAGPGVGGFPGMGFPQTQPQSNPMSSMLPLLMMGGSDGGDMSAMLPLMMSGMGGGSGGSSSMMPMMLMMMGQE